MDGTDAEDRKQQVLQNSAAPFQFAVSLAPGHARLRASVAAIREAIEQSRRGEGRPASEVLARLHSELRLPFRDDER